MIFELSICDSMISGSSSEFVNCNLHLHYSKLNCDFFFFLNNFRSFYEFIVQYWLVYIDEILWYSASCTTGFMHCEMVLYF